MNEIIAGEKDINNEVFLNYFQFQNPLFLAKDLFRVTQAKNEKLVNNVNDGLINLINVINKKEIPENENPTKVVNIVEKILDFYKQQKGKELPSDLTCVTKVFNRKLIKILTPKQLLQVLPIAFAQVKAGNTSENLLNEIKRIIYSLYWAKEITKKLYNNIMNSIKL